MDIEITEDFIAEEQSRARRLFTRKKHSGLGGFEDADALASWWVKTLIAQKACCIYCETSIFLIKELISRGQLNARSVKREGRRGPSLELERSDPQAPYSPENCTLACYYCNNDKSYIYCASEYKRFMAPARNAHFKYLGEKLKSI